MQSISILATIVGIHALAWLTPGPMTVLLIRNSLIYSKRAGVWTSVGIALGNFVHLLFAALGVSAILTNSEIAYGILLYAGIAYLIFLGLKTLAFDYSSSPAVAGKDIHDARVSPVEAFRMGLIANLLSPKAFIFFLSVVAGVYATDPPAWVVISLVLLLPINSLLMASMYVHVFSRDRVRKTYAKFQIVINRILGLALIALAVLVATNS